MAKLNKTFRIGCRVFSPVVLVIGAAAVVFGAFQDVSGGTGLWVLSPSDLITVGTALVVVFGAIIILRHEFLLHEVQELIGNKYARELMNDGIPPYRESYIQYVRSGNFEVVNRFWSAGIANLSDVMGRSDLHVASEYGHSQIVEGILQRGGDPKQIDASKRTPLMLAMIDGHHRVAEALLKHVCAINATSPDDGLTALHTASAYGHLHLIRMLIMDGANIDAVDHNNLTPIMFSIAKAHWNTVECLISLGADVTRVDSSGANLMDYALAFEAPETLIRHLNDAGVAQSNPALKTTGGGFSRYGRVSVKWEVRNDC